MYSSSVKPSWQVSELSRPKLAISRTQAESELRLLTKRHIFLWSHQFSLFCVSDYTFFTIWHIKFKFVSKRFTLFDLKLLRRKKKYPTSSIVIFFATRADSNFLRAKPSWEASSSSWIRVEPSRAELGCITSSYDWGCCYLLCSTRSWGCYSDSYILK